MDESQITGSIVDAVIEVHRELGPGLLESVYVRALQWELSTRRIHTQAEVPLPVKYRGHPLGFGFRADLIVEHRVIVEVKAVERTAPVHMKQVLTYLRVTGHRVGLLLNFGQATLREGIRRIVNG